MKFNEEYTQYWESAVNKSIDGTLISGVSEAKQILKLLDIKKADLILDLGCSYGRMYEALSIYSDEIFGVDPDPYAIEKSKLFPYRKVLHGTAEDTGYKTDFFDLVFCWAVFDVVDHKKGLKEINRVLKNQGNLVLTGKNAQYDKEDILAFKAEKNAFLKGFPNKFTDLFILLNNLQSYGFELENLLIFPRRGDLGRFEFIEVKGGLKNDQIFYEYIITCKKISGFDAVNVSDKTFELPISKTATEKAHEAGYPSVRDFFESIGVD